MKRKITFFVILTVALTGCFSLVGPKKPPRCDGKYTRVLNKDKWDWNNTGAILQERSVRPVTTPVILNTSESEKSTINVTPKRAELSPIAQETPSSKTVEIAREK